MLIVGFGCCSCCYLFADCFVCLFFCVVVVEVCVCV